MAQSLSFEGDTIGSPPKGWVLTMTAKAAQYGVWSGTIPLPRRDWC